MANKEIELDPLSERGAYLGPSSDESSSLEEEESSVEMPSSSSLSEEPQVDLKTRCEKLVDSFLDHKTPNADETTSMLDLLLCYIKLLVIIHQWSSSTLQNISIEDDDTDDDILIKLLYYRWDSLLRDSFRPCLENRAKMRLEVFRRDMAMSLGGVMDENHPMLYVLRALQGIKCVWGRRKLKRSPSSSPDYYDAWAGRCYDTAQEEQLVGDDPLRTKQLWFYQRPDDLDPNAVNLEDMDIDTAEPYNYWVDEINGRAPNLLQPFSVAVPQFVHAQLMFLHNMLHFEHYVDQGVMDFLGDAPEEPPSSWDGVWSSLCGEKYKNASIHEFAKSTNTEFRFVELVAQFRDVLKANLTMITCAVCKKHCNARYTECKHGDHCVYHCHSCGAESALAAHEQAFHQKKTRRKKKK